MEDWTARSLRIHTSAGAYSGLMVSQHPCLCRCLLRPYDTAMSWVAAQRLTRKLGTVVYDNKRKTIICTLKFHCLLPGVQKEKQKAPRAATSLAQGTAKTQIPCHYYLLLHFYTQDVLPPVTEDVTLQVLFVFHVLKSFFSFFNKVQCHNIYTKGSIGRFLLHSCFYFFLQNKFPFLKHGQSNFSHSSFSPSL